jgi:hypothetical protein
MIHCFVKGFFELIYFGDRVRFLLVFSGFSGTSVLEDSSEMGFFRTLQAEATERVVQALDPQAEKPAFSRLFMTKKAPERLFSVFGSRRACPKD